MIKGIYSYWCTFWFLVLFAIHYPFLWLAATRKEWHHWSSLFYKSWSRLLYFLMGIRVREDWQFKPQKKQAYVYAANHTSFLDIAVMVMTVPYFSVFMGKASISKVPLFGYIFRKVHIPVHRGKGKSRQLAFEQVTKAIGEGKNILIYPEGGIFSENPPEMIAFKDGAFKAAIQKQVPLVPVSILYNWIILPDKKPIHFRHHHCHLIYHEPIDTKGMDENDVKNLKNQAFDIIQEGINENLKN